MNHEVVIMQHAMEGQVENSTKQNQPSLSVYLAKCAFAPGVDVHPWEVLRNHQIFFCRLWSAYVYV